MLRYFLNRLLLIFPTLFLIISLNFLFIQLAPGGPVEQISRQINHQKISGESSGLNAVGVAKVGFIEFNQKSALDDEILGKLKKQFGFDLSLYQRFILMLKSFIFFDFGESFYQNSKVIDIIMEKIPVSLSLGLWTLMLTYIIAIAIGVKKAVSANSAFDKISNIFLVLTSCVPSFVLAVILISIFCGGNFLAIFPLKGLTSVDFVNLKWWQKIFDYLWHLFLPIFVITITSLASLAIFCRNNFLEEFNKNYVKMLISKGVSWNSMIYFHISRNSLMLIIGSLPAQIITVFLTSSILIEVIFSLDGLGLMTFEAMNTRDYPIIFASLFIFSLVGLLANLVADFCYYLIDPRLHFKKLSK
jgi:microcin C transport system permease protein